MITVLTGDNSFLIKEAFEELKNKFTAQYGGAAVEVLDPSNLDIEKLSSVLTGASLFSENKFIVIRELSQNKDLAEHFIKIYKKIPETTDVIIIEPSIDKRTSFYKTLKKEFNVTEFNDFSESEMINWVMKNVKKLGGTISRGDAAKLVNYSGLDLAKMHNEVNKLVAYQPEVNVATIEELVEKKPQDTVFQLLDACISGRTDDAITILENLEKAHEDPFAIASMLIWQIHIVAVVSSAGNRPDSEVSKQTKINPYVIQKTKRLTSKLSKNKIKQMIDSVAQMDIKLKSSNGNPWRLLEQTILKLGQKK